MTVPEVPISSPLFTIIDRLRLDRVECRRFFDWFAETAESRIRTLITLIQVGHGNKWEPSYSEKDLRFLDVTLTNRVKSRPFSHSELVGIQRSFPNQFRGVQLPRETLDDPSILLCINAGSYFGKVMINTVDGVRWYQDLSDPTFVDYGYPLLRCGNNTRCCNPLRLMFVFGLNTVSHRSRKSIPEMLGIWKTLLATP
jgi:hypothetical protein